jgi:hypothetical protein
MAEEEVMKNLLYQHPVFATALENVALVAPPYELQPAKYRNNAEYGLWIYVVLLLQNH